MTGLCAQVPAQDFDVDLNGVDVVVLYYNSNPVRIEEGAGPLWPEFTRKEFEEFVSKGGGLVVIHATNNSFAHWPAYNQMTGIGGWGGRSRDWGPYIYYNDQGELVRDPASDDWRTGSDGPPHEFLVQTRNNAHPIMAGLPEKWLHCRDEIYERLRGPATNLDVLATAYSDGRDDATRRHEPVAMAIGYGKGRVFHTPMGHWTYSMQCVGFQTLLQRGTEWAATGGVTQAVPADFPTETSVSYRKLEWDGVRIAEWTPYL